MPVWRMKGEYLASCSCDPGCPCQFNQDPTHGVCEAVLAMNIVEGNYGDVPLGGLNWVAAYKFPGPIHLGNGAVQRFIDSRASDKQRAALLDVLGGTAGGPWFEILNSVTSRVEQPQFVPIDFQFDLKGRRATLTVKGAVETVVEPIKNPVTGQEHRAQISLPDGIEFKVAEIGTATVNRVSGALSFDWRNCHTHLAEVEHTQQALAA